MGQKKSAIEGWHDNITMKIINQTLFLLKAKNVEESPGAFTAGGCRVEHPGDNVFQSARVQF